LKGQDERYQHFTFVVDALEVSKNFRNNVENLLPRTSGKNAITQLRGSGKAQGDDNAVQGA